ncbi:hypothetical protein WA171_000275, partial [Blastocystis sp. BT1]
MESIWLYLFIFILALVWTPIIVHVSRSEKRVHIILLVLMLIVVIGVIVIGIAYRVFLTTALGIAFFIAAELYETAGTYISMNRAPMSTLPDYLFEWIPHKETTELPLIGKIHTKTIGDVLMGLLILPVTISLLFLKDNFLMLRKALLLLGITGFFRPLTFCCTSLSDPCPSSPTNQAGHPVDIHPTLREGFKHAFNFLAKPTTFFSAGDMIFSGHTRFVVAAISVLGTLITRENQSYMIPLFLIALVAGIFAMFTFIKSRMHYSVDVILAVFITSSLWQIICQSSSLAAIPNEPPNISIMSRLWI